MNDEEYICLKCRGTFLKGRSDETSLQEMKDTFPDPPLGTSPKIDLLCDDCFNAFMSWYKIYGQRKTINS